MTSVVLHQRVRVHAQLAVKKNALDKQANKSYQKLASSFTTIF